MCLFCLVEADAIAKEKQLERDARRLEKQAIAMEEGKLEKEAIEKKKELEREERKLKKDAVTKRKQEREARNLEKVAYVCDHCNKSFFMKHHLKNHVDKNVCIPATEATTEATGFTHEQIQQEISRHQAKVANTPEKNKLDFG